MKPFYKSDDWLSLRHTTRYYLLPTIEDIRPGCLLYEKSDKSLLCCLNERGFSYKKKESLYLASKDISLLERTVELFSNKKLQLEKSYHEAMGEFFGYPDCCIGRFYEGIMKGERVSSQFGKKLKKELKGRLFSKKKALVYIYHAACSVDCKESLRLGREIRKSLKKDPEAKRYIESLGW